jgi:hypothetical protein
MTFFTTVSTPSVSLDHVKNSLRSSLILSNVAVGVRALAMLGKGNGSEGKKGKGGLEV